MKSIIVETTIDNPMTYLIIVAIKYKVFSDKLELNLKLDFNIDEERRNSDFVFLKPEQRLEGYKRLKPCFFQKVNIECCDYIYENPKEFWKFEDIDDPFEKIIDNFFQEIEFKSVRSKETIILCAKKNIAVDTVNDFIKGLNKAILIIQKTSYEEKKQIINEQLLIDDKVVEQYLEIYYDLI